ncbi:hypothetical protein [Allorhodopirellula heiligendammensis]|uniref:Uncharacterized protein n=1 Tax=Allorhodopirellula heiligendammensis TaxID=2714739 RepID=A0A5C6BYK7_9BACT|nr:hypothetical protein [Allorhodopirellula heiligendammensis]TWU16767.1 hypothetical protein Poly21_39730 [Allorhodopirellula heiligendammensis]
MKSRSVINGPHTTCGGVMLALVWGLVTSAPALAQPPTTGPAEGARATQNSGVEPDNEGGSTSNRQARLSRYLTGATFTGAFTVDGREDVAPKAESYTITSCEPLPEKNRYRLKVKIRYGDVDGEFPMDLDILMAGSTPVITLDAMAIPGLGTFSARVLFHSGRYAGTWQHGAKGGHLYGKITPAEK